MPRIIVNGEPREIEDGATVRELLVATGYGDRRVAVEINREIVPKSAHAQRRVVEDDRIEIVHALGGG